MFITGNNQCWIERRSIEGEKTAEPLGVSSPTGGYGPCSSDFSAAVWNGNALGLLWVEPQGEVFSLYFVELPLYDTPPPEPLLLAQARVMARGPALLWDGTWSGFWTERTSSGDRVLAQRIDPERAENFENLLLTSVREPRGLQATLSDGAMSAFWEDFDLDAVTVRPRAARIDTCK